MSHSSSYESSSLSGPLKTLYPLACLLAGPDEASDLLRRVYRQAAERPPAERPDDQEAWVRALVRTFKEEGATMDSGLESQSEETAPLADPLRQDVAENLVESALPVAFAACSAEERFLLAVDAIEEFDETALSPRSTGLDITISDARATLHHHLQDVLSTPEYALVDAAVSEAFLRRAVRDLVATRFSPVPRPIRSEVQAAVQAVRTAESPAENDAPADEASSPPDGLPARPRPRSLLFTLVIGIMVLAGGVGVWYWTGQASSPSTSTTSLVAFSAERAATVAPELISSSPDEVKAFVESTWDRQIRIPQIKGARLQGVGRLSGSSDTEVPVLLYADMSDSTRIAAFVYSYALIDRLEDKATLPPDLRDALAQPRHLVSGGQSKETGLLWRDREDIFVVVAPPSFPADSLRSQLQP